MYVCQSFKLKREWTCKKFCIQVDHDLSRICFNPGLQSKSRATPSSHFKKIVSYVVGNMGTIKKAGHFLTLQCGNVILDTIPDLTRTVRAIRAYSVRYLNPKRINDFLNTMISFMILCLLAYILRKY